MRRSLVVSIITALVLPVVALSAPATAAELAPTHSSVAAAVTDPATTQSTVYRFWSPKNKTHFYTMSVAERDNIISTFPLNEWTYEGARYQAFATQQPGTIPLYRFWSPTFKGHFFTAVAAEKDAVISGYDDSIWTYEGIAYYVYPTDSTAPSTLVARFWSPNNKHHFYTADPAEAASVKGFPAAEWTYEGFNFRVPSSIALDIPGTPTQYVAPVVVPPVYVPPVVVPPTTPYYQNCDDVRAHGAAPIHRGDPGFQQKFDRDNDGIGCE